MGCKPYSNFNLVGAAQVGKSSLTGMRVLHRLERRLPVWPVDPLPERGSVVVEIYTAIAAIAAGRAPRAVEDARATRSSTRRSRRSGHRRSRGAGPLDDHSADALLTAAWLRVAGQPRRAVAAGGPHARARPHRRLDLRRAMTQRQSPKTSLPA